MASHFSVATLCIALGHGNRDVTAALGDSCSRIIEVFVHIRRDFCHVFGGVLACFRHVALHLSRTFGPVAACEHAKQQSG